jgi:hypothetical protein
MSKGNDGTMNNATRLKNASANEALEAVIRLKDLTSQIEAGGSPTGSDTISGSTTRSCARSHCWSE